MESDDGLRKTGINGNDGDDKKADAISRSQPVRDDADIHLRADIPDRAKLTFFDKVGVAFERWRPFVQFPAITGTLGLVIFQIHGNFFAPPPLTFGEEETQRMHDYQARDAQFFVWYHEIIIESRTGNTFQMNSRVSRSRQDVRMTWQDTAAFKDADGKDIPRNRPCQPEYPENGVENAECFEDDLGWFQHQWWREVMPLKKETSFEPWEYTQKKIPDAAHEMQLCSHQTIRVYESFLGAVDKTQTICTDWYVLADIPEKEAVK